MPRLFWSWIRWHERYNAARDGIIGTANHFSMRPPQETMAKMAEHNIHITQQPISYTLEGRYAANLDGWRLATIRCARRWMPALPSRYPAIFCHWSHGWSVRCDHAQSDGTVYGPDGAITIEEAVLAIP